MNAVPQCQSGDSGRLPARRSPAAVLAWSESLLDGWGMSMSTSRPDPGLALWVSRTPAVAIGLAQTAESVANLAAMEVGGVALLRRQSGGGAVLLSPGVLCWEAWATEDALRRLPDGGTGIRPAYAALSMPIRSGLGRLGVDAPLTGVCDLAVRSPDGEARKIAGMAQLRRHDQVLVHGCILAALDLNELEKYLPLPADADAPDYRRGRAHRAFCASVAEVLGLPPGKEQAEGLTARLAASVKSSATELGWTVLSPPEELAPPASRLLDEKYACDEWNFRRARGKNIMNNADALTVH